MIRRPPQGAGLAIGLGLALAAGCGADECQRQIEAAYQKLQSSGRPYRVQIVQVAADGLRSAREERYPVYRVETVRPGADVAPGSTFEYVPPDRRRMVNALDGGETFIQVGKSVWGRSPESPWAALPREVGPSLLAYHWPGLERTGYTCLGPVQAYGKTYLGYRAQHNPKTVVRLARRVEEFPLVSPRKAEKLWTTVLVDPDTGLLAHEIVALESRPDQPERRYDYTYPDDLVIAAPAQ